VAAVAVAVATGVAVSVATSGAGHHRPGPRPPVPAPPARAFPRLPSSVAARLDTQGLFISDDGGAEAVTAGGRVLARVPNVSDDATDAFDAGDGTVVYHAGQDVYVFDPARDSTTDLGHGTVALPVGPERIDVVTAAGRRQRVTPVALAAGTVASRGRPATSYLAPAAERVVAASAAGIVLEDPAGRLSLVPSAAGRTRLVTGPVSHVVAVSGDELAWTSVAGCPLALTGDCPLHLTDLRTGAQRSIVPPRSIGASAVGAFSPDGRTLAVYELPAATESAPLLDVDLVTVGSGHVRRLASVAVAATSPTLAWSPSGEWLYVGRRDAIDAFDVDPPPGSAAVAGPVPLPVPPGCCVVGF
jgi:hypothetical protein